MYIYIYTYIHTHMYTYIHTCIHTYTYTKHKVVIQSQLSLSHGVANMIKLVKIAQHRKMHEIHSNTCELQETLLK